MTRKSDRLPTLSGIAALFQSKNLGSYLAGLWQNNLACHMHWKSMRCNQYVKRIAKPSWSWPSTDGPISYEGPSTELEAAVTILSAKTQPEGSLGKTEFGSIVLVGRTIEAELMLDWFDGVRPDESFAAYSFGGKLVPFMLDVAQYPMEATQRCDSQIMESQLTNGQRIVCVLLLTKIPQQYPIILTLRQSLQCPGAYERVGIALEGPLKSIHTWFKNAERRNLRLV